LKYKDIFLIFVFCFFIFTCSGRTYYTINIDALSYMNEEDLISSFSIPFNEGINIYLLPGVQVGTTNEDPDEDMQKGLLITFSEPEQQNPEIQVELNLLSTFFNVDDIDNFTGGSIQIFFSPATSLNIYTEGELVSEVLIQSILAGENKEVETILLLDTKSEQYDIIKQGTFRIGIKINLDPNFDQPVDMKYIAESLYLKIITRPFSLIP